MSDNLFELYSQKILSYATQSVRTAPIETANAYAKKRSPVCGSKIEVSLRVENDIVADYSQIVSACALGQASSSIFAEQVIGQSKSDINTLRDELIDFLTKDGKAPSAPFAQYAVLKPAQMHPNRHASILLPIEATLLAFETTSKKNRAQ